MPLWLIDMYICLYFLNFDSCETDRAQQMTIYEEQEKSRTAGSP